MTDGSKTCPKCAESVRAEAKICRHCGHEFGKKDGPLESTTTKNGGMLKKGLGCLGIAFVFLIVVGILAPKDTQKPGIANDVVDTSSNSGARGSAARTDEKGVPADSEAGLTQENFERIKDGMTVDQVADILGAPGEKMSESSAGDSTIAMYQWIGGMLSGRVVIGTFDNGKLMSKTQTGL